MSLGDVQLHLVNSLDEAMNLLRWLGERRRLNALGVDTETGGFDRVNDPLRMVQVGDENAGWAIPWERWGGVFEDIARRWEGDFILHNAPFDLAFLDREGVKLPRHRVHDTMVQAAINESHMSKALKNQAARHVDATAAGLQLSLGGTGFDWATVPIEFPQYWTYGALDPVLTYRIHEHHYPVVAREAPRAYDLEMAVLWVVEKMQRNGIRIDIDFTREHYNKFTAYCESVQAWCARTHNVSAGSNAAIIDILERDGFTFSKATKSGAKSLDAEVLDGIEHPLARAVLGRRQAQKMASTYLKFYLEHADGDHLIHPSFNTLGARTSRMSCSDPNFQNVPRLGTNTFADVVRSCVISRFVSAEQLVLGKFTQDDAHRYGSLIFADFSQIEMRLLAHFAREPAMIQAFKSEGDFFVNLARQIYQDETIDKKDERRRITKNSGYAKIYGAGVRKFALTAGIPEGQARAFLNRFDVLYPGVRGYQNDVINEAMTRKNETGQAYVRSPFTNRRFTADERKEYALTNYQIQGAAAEVNKMKLVELDAAGVSDWLTATIHDEVMLDVPGEHVSDVIATVEKIMNDDQLLSVPITAEVSFGARWGKKRDWGTDL